MFKIIIPISILAIMALPISIPVLLIWGIPILGVASIAGALLRRC